MDLRVVFVLLGEDDLLPTKKKQRIHISWQGRLFDRKYCIHVIFATKPMIFFIFVIHREGVYEMWVG